VFAQILAAAGIAHGIVARIVLLARDILIESGRHRRRLLHVARIDHEVDRPLAARTPVGASEDEVFVNNDDIARLGLDHFESRQGSIRDDMGQRPAAMSVCEPDSSRKAPPVALIRLR
jgi:hypothetical protein